MEKLLTNPQRGAIKITLNIWRHSLSWLERSLHMREVTGSSPVVSTKKVVLF